MEMTLITYCVLNSRNSFLMLAKIKDIIFIDLR